MIGIGDDQAAELIRISKRCEWTVNQTNDLAEFDLRWCSPQPVAALRTPNAFHDARVLEFQQNQFKKLLRQVAIHGDVPDLDGFVSVSAAKGHYRLQRVKPFLRDLQSCIPFELHRSHLHRRLADLVVRFAFETNAMPQFEIEQPPDAI